ncbi:MAG: hypothetical protein JO019_02145, partial [Candidatus Kaiserbacteria bacterium]|nr:hypothetical protein [Candidatus Kaiserbacteria bacterium]
SIVSGPATISGNTITITGTGTVDVRASQAGNSLYSAATPVDQTFTVNPANQTISFGALANHTYGDAAFGVSATATSGLAVSFSIVSGPATISGNTITITNQDGTSYTIDASNAQVEKLSTIPLSQVAVGDKIGVEGTVSGTNVTAQHIMDGMPQKPDQD